jgi:peroxiredoxin
MRASSFFYRFAVLIALLSFSLAGVAQRKPIEWTDQQKPIVDAIKHLRSVPDDKRGQVTRDVALQIRQLPASDNKLELAVGLAGLSTEGDFGHHTLEEVATTLADTLKQHAPPEDNGQPAYPYVELASLVRYEHVQASSDDPQFAKAMAKLEQDDQRRANADFTLTDLNGHQWTLKSLRGKVALVNFWATWCPPCRKELPDLEQLSERFKDQGLVILALSDEDVAKVKPFVEQRNLTYPVLLDTGGKVAKEYDVDGIPKTFVYDRDGKLVAQAIDMRTQKQFLEMLGKAGIK